MKRGTIAWMVFLLIGWVVLADAQNPPAQEGQTLPPEVQALQKKAVEARLEAQALDLEAARAQVAAAEADLAFTDALVKYTKELAEKDKKAKEWAKQVQKRLAVVRQNLENARARLDAILYPPPDAETAAPTIQASKRPESEQKPPPRMEDQGGATPGR